MPDRTERQGGSGQGWTSSISFGHHFRCLWPDPCLFLPSGEHLCVGSADTAQCYPRGPCLRSVLPAAHLSLPALLTPRHRMLRGSAFIMVQKGREVCAQGGQPLTNSILELVAEPSFCLTLDRCFLQVLESGSLRLTNELPMVVDSLITPSFWPSSPASLPLAPHCFTP